jgi:hypothetical protein
VLGQPGLYSERSCLKKKINKGKRRGKGGQGRFLPRQRAKLRSKARWWQVVWAKGMDRTRPTGKDKGDICDGGV